MSLIVIAKPFLYSFVSMDCSELWVNASTRLLSFIQFLFGSEMFRIHLGLVILHSGGRDLSVNLARIPQGLALAYPSTALPRQ